MDIAFGNCVSMGGYHYALILVDRATHYNWAFGLKTLSSDCILSLVVSRFVSKLGEESYARYSFAICEF
jgi:hypothetical protein